jgi:hypothetical protein
LRRNGFRAYAGGGCGANRSRAVLDKALVPEDWGWKEIYKNGPPTGMHLPHVDSHTAMVTIHFWVVSPIFFKMWHAQCSTRRVTGVIAA